MRIARVLAVAVMAGALVAGGAASAQENIEELAQLCATCHGEDGMPQKQPEGVEMPPVPIIWGQHAGYLYIQMKDFKSGFRKSEIMQPLVSEMEKADMLALAQYFSKKPWPKTGYKTEEADKSAGERVSVAGLCKECHLDNYVGDGTIPRAGGQLVTYLEYTMHAFKTRERGNNPDKSTLISSYSDEDLKAMSRYLAGIQVNQ